MALPEPRPGLVIRYDYLWTPDATAGRDQGEERSACLVAATDPVDPASSLTASLRQGFSLK
jgi:hypothetical protein